MHNDEFEFPTYRGNLFIKLSEVREVQIFLNNYQIKHFSFHGLTSNCYSKSQLWAYLRNCFVHFSNFSDSQTCLRFFPKSLGGGNSPTKEKSFITNEEKKEIRELINTQKNLEHTENFDQTFHSFLETFKHNQPEKSKEKLQDLLKYNFNQLHDVGRYYEKLFDKILSKTGFFQKIDISQTFKIKEDILDLIQYLALAYFYDCHTLGIKITKTEVEEKSKILQMHIDWAIASEGQLSHSQILFSLEVIKLIIDSIPNSKSIFMELNLGKQLNVVVAHLAMLNFVGAASSLIGGVAKDLGLAIAAGMKKTFGQNLILSILYIQALANTIIADTTKSEKNIVNFLELVQKAISKKYMMTPDWKIFYKLAFELGRLAQQIPDDGIKDLILFGSETSDLPCLEDFVSFKKFWRVIKNHNWRIKEKALEGFLQIYETTNSSKIKNKIKAVFVAIKFQNESHIKNKIDDILENDSSIDDEVRMRAVSIISKAIQMIGNELEEIQESKDLGDSQLAEENDLKEELSHIQSKIEKENDFILSELKYEIAGQKYFALKNYDEAIENYKKALITTRERFGPSSIEIANSYQNLANVYYHAEKYDESLQNGLRAYELKSDFIGKTRYSLDVLTTLIANCYFKMKIYDQALIYYHISKRIRKLHFGKGHLETGKAYSKISECYKYQNEYKKAKKYIKKALKIFIFYYGVEGIETAFIYNQMGSLYFMKNNKLNKSVKMFEKAQNILIQNLGPNHQSLVSIYFNLAYAAELNNKYQDSLRFNKEALSILNENPGKNKSEIITCFTNMADCCYNLELYSEAATFYEKALDYTIKYQEYDQSSISIYYKKLGECHKYLGENEKSENYFKKAKIFSGHS